MQSIRRTYPYIKKFLLLSIYDIIDSLCATAVVDNGTEIIKSELTVYQNKSEFTFSVIDGQYGSDLIICITKSAPSLSKQGEIRAIDFLFSSIEQLIENTNYEVKLREASQSK